jgi:prevent-host-death family protein
MMVSANMHYAKTHLSELIDLAQQGEEIILCKNGQPMARVIPYVTATEPRKLGLWAGKIQIADDFDELPPSLKGFFE